MSEFTKDKKIYKNPPTATYTPATSTTPVLLGTLYTVTANRKFYPTSIMVLNSSTATIVVGLYDNATSKIPIALNPSTATTNTSVTFDVEDLEGFTFEQGTVTVYATSNAAGTFTIAIAGYEE
jgi:hypothetical protein